jgi:hypothetical protein
VVVGSSTSCIASTITFPAGAARRATSADATHRCVASPAAERALHRLAHGRMHRCIDASSARGMRDCAASRQFSNGEAFEDVGLLEAATDSVLTGGRRQLRDVVALVPDRPLRRGQLAR